MKQTIVPILTFVAGLALGYFIHAIDKNDQIVVPERQPLYWVAPMDPDYRRDGPGKSPMGMNLVPVFQDFIDLAKGQEGIMITPSVQNNLSVRVQAVRMSEPSTEISVVGFVKFNEDKTIHLHSRSDGWIEKLHIRSVGSRVSKGDRAFELYSPELVNSQEEYVAALQSGNQPLISGSLRRLRLLGVDETQLAQLKSTQEVQRLVSFAVPESGFVSELGVGQGMYVRPETQIATLSTLQDIWVIGDVVSRDAGRIKVDNPVTLTSESYPQRTWHGKVDYIYPTMEVITRTLSFRSVFRNLDGTLKPNMFVHLSIDVGSDGERLSIPKSAVIRGSRGDHVVKALGGGSFKSVMIKAGRAFKGDVEVLAGLAEGDLVVTSGQFLLDSESNIDAGLLRMDSRSALEMDSRSHQQDSMDMDDSPQSQRDQGNQND